MDDMRKWMNVAAMLDEVTISTADISNEILGADDNVIDLLQYIQRVYRSYKMVTRDFTRPTYKLPPGTLQSLRQVIENIYQLQIHDGIPINRNGPVWSVYQMMWEYAFDHVKNDRVLYKW